MNTAMIISAIGALTALTNIVVQVLKQLTGERLPASLLACATAVALTMLAFFAWASYTHTLILWYYPVAAFIAGILVAYAAMFGFDKLREILATLERCE